ncbi:WXG100 family type VII secretion target [Nocardia cyriacigeorgica]
MTTVGSSEKPATEPGTLTTSQVLAWQPATLATLGDRWSSQAQQLRAWDDARYRAVDASRDFWRSSAGDALRAKHDEVRTETRTLITALEDGGSAAKSGAAVLDSARAAVADAIRAAEAKGYEIADDGTAAVSAATRQVLLARSPDAAAYSIAASAMQSNANAATIAVRTALDNARSSAAGVKTAIEEAFVHLPNGESVILTGAPPVSTSPSVNRVYPQFTDQPYPDPNAKSGDRMPVTNPQTVNLDADKYTTQWTPWSQSWSVPSGSINEGKSYRVRIVGMTQKEIYNNDGKAIMIWEPQYQIQEQTMTLPITGGQGYPIVHPPSDWRDASFDEVSKLQKDSGMVLSVPDPVQDVS